MRDRREVLKMLAGGTAVAAGATLVTNNVAFADGGTATSRRPTCGTASVTTWASNTPDGRITLSVTPGTTTCPGTGWTPSNAVLFQITPTTLVITDSGGTTLPTTNGWTAPQPVSGTLTTIVRSPAPPGNGDIPTGTSVTITISVRRTCSNGTRRSWCCTTYTTTGTFTVNNGGSNDTWAGGANNGTLGTGTTPFNDANGCP